MGKLSVGCVMCGRYIVPYFLNENEAFSNKTGKGLVIKYRGGGGGPAEIGGGSSIFKLMKRGGSPKYWSCL